MTLKHRAVSAGVTFIALSVVAPLFALAAAYAAYDSAKLKFRDAFRRAL